VDAPVVTSEEQGDVPSRLGVAASTGAAASTPTASSAAHRTADLTGAAGSLTSRGGGGTSQQAPVDALAAAVGHTGDCDWSIRCEAWISGNVTKRR